MFRITNINQPVITAPRTGMNNRFNSGLPANNDLQRFLLNMRDNFGKDFIVSIIGAEDNGFAAGSAIAFAFHTTRSEVRFIKFNLTGKRLLTLINLRKTNSNFQIDLIDCFMS